MQFLELITLFFVSLPAAIIVAVSSIGNTAPFKQPPITNASSTIHAIGVTIIPLPSPTPTRTPVKIVPTTSQQLTTQSNKSADEWGVAKKLDEHTYTIKVEYDGGMSSGQDIMNALNVYRARNGKEALSWDSRLADYASTRANTFKSMGNTDTHAGFENYLNNEDGFSKLGFNRLGENSYFGGPLTGTHLIEWVFSQSPGHNANQLDSWSHVGIGVTDTSVNLNFGGN